MKIKELKEICQTTAKKDRSNFYMRYVCRSISIFFTRVLIHTPIQADYVSFLMIVVGVLGALCLLDGTVGYFVLGAVVLQLWYVLDCVDGEIARYRNYEKKGQIIQEKADMPITGAYWDYLNHYIVHGLVPFCMSWGLYQTSGELRWVMVGFVGSFFQMLLLAVHDTKSRGFVAKIKKLTASGERVVRGQKDAGFQDKKSLSWSLSKWIFVVMHYSVTYPTVMNVLLLLSLLELGAHGQGRLIFLLYYGVASAVVFFALAIKNLRSQGVDRDFESQFEIINL